MGCKSCGKETKVAKDGKPYSYCYTCLEKKRKAEGIVPHTANTQKDGYWENKEQRDKEKEPVILRLACMKVAGQLVSTLMRNGDPAASREPTKLVEDYTKRLEKFVNEVKT